MRRLISWIGSKGLKRQVRWVELSARVKEEIGVCSSHTE